MAVELTKEEEKTEWYLVLGLESTADDAAISKAFKKLSLRWHPDKNQGSKDAEKMFMMVKEAKIFLLDAKKRKTYDEKRNARLKAEAQLVRRWFCFCIFPNTLESPIYMYNLTSLMLAARKQHRGLLATVATSLHRRGFFLEFGVVSGSLVHYTS